jgi:formylglycine-generating enzyme required for sulfatase activity
MCAASLDILPQPFGWIAIPAGKVKIIAIDSKERPGASYIPRGTSQIFEVAPFEIGKYPLTNAQFAKFVEAGGYSQRQWWTDAGWQEKEQNNWTEPLYWQDAKWNRAEYPVVGVSWYEAVAFCQWLSDITGEMITLPTEQQWQRAAQGDTDRLAAWGDHNDYKYRCNWYLDPEGLEGSTSPVTQYEGKGDSPYGVVDMNGNVWEWCLTAFETGSNALNEIESRILRGGGWVLLYSHETNIGNIDRLPHWPTLRLDYQGFRCVRLGNIT